MSTELEIAPQNHAPMTALDIRAQVNRIQEVMRSVMQDGQHYGKIPGAGDKPTLLKAGAEKLIMTFRLAPETEVEPLFLEGGIGYRVKVRLLTFDGRFVGSGVGECSSLEEKYKWRGAVCDEEYEETPVDQRRIKFSKKYGKVEKIKQGRTNPHSLSHTSSPTVNGLSAFRISYRFFPARISSNGGFQILSSWVMEIPFRNASKRLALMF